ncbi:MAG: hypothetical protein AAGU14_05535 [Eubacteriaceae bacterium]
MKGKQTSSVGSFFRILLSNIIILFFVTACVYQGVYKLNNLSPIAERTITKFAINAEWIDIVLFFCSAVLLIILIIYFDKAKLQKRRRDKKIIKLENTIEELKYKYENPQKNENTTQIVETESNEENLDTEKNKSS